MTPKFFRTPEAFRRWLSTHHDKDTELWVGFYKVASGKGGMVYKQALDEALCYGWIDGLVRRVDEASYAQRFTPRRPRSHWSLVNIKRVKELIAEGRMQPPGLAAFEAREASLSGTYSFEQAEQQKPVTLGPEYERRFRADGEAWAFFSAQAPSYRRAVTWWVVSAKREETRERRLAQLIGDSRAGRRVQQGAPGAAKP
jgi:uncharacterized protein YdeI (YjbR/CyaY-like superfamily)